MLKNNIVLDVKTKCIEEEITQAQVAQMVGTSPQYVSRLINNSGRILNKTYISMLEALGYDIELNYVKRGE